MPSYYPYALIAGIISGGLFFVVSALGLGFVFVFLPTLPLLYYALGKHPKVALLGGFIACLLVAAIVNFTESIFFLIVYVMPSYYMARQALKQSSNGEWAPIGPIFLTLTACACIVMGLITLHFASQPETLEQMLSQQVQAEFSGMDSRYMAAMLQLITQWPFFVFAFTIWVWNLSLYLHTWLANQLLRRNRRAIREQLRLDVFIMPNWILSLLAIAGLASLIGSPYMQFFGKLCLMALLFPYFLLGLAFIHTRSKLWPNRKLFLFFMYFTLLIQPLPWLVIVAIGFYLHIKHLSAAPTSTKS